MFCVWLFQIRKIICEKIAAVLHCHVSFPEEVCAVRVGNTSTMMCENSHQCPANIHS